MFDCSNHLVIWNWCRVFISQLSCIGILEPVDLHPTQSLCLIFMIWPHTFTRWRWYKSWADLLRVQFHPSSRPGRSSSLHLFLSSFSPFFDPDLLLCSSAETSSSPVDIPHLLFCFHHPPWPHLHPPHQYPLPLLFALLHPPQIFPIPLSSQPNSSLFFWPTLPSLISPLLTSPFQSSTLPPPLPAPHLTTPTTNQSTGRKVKTRSCHKIQNMLVQNWEQTIFCFFKDKQTIIGIPPLVSFKGPKSLMFEAERRQDKAYFCWDFKSFLAAWRAPMGPSIIWGNEFSEWWSRDLKVGEGSDNRNWGTLKKCKLVVHLKWRAISEMFQKIDLKVPDATMCTAKTR